MRFEFATATRIIFRMGSLKEAGRQAAAMGRHAFIITGRSVERAAVLIAGLNENGLTCSQFSTAGEPTTDLALVDPEMTFTMPPSLTVGTGLDAFTQLLEAFVSHRANPPTASPGCEIYAGS